MNQQIKDELDVYASEIKLEDAKRINGLRAVFGEVSFLTSLRHLTYCMSCNMYI